MKLFRNCYAKERMRERILLCVCVCVYIKILKGKQVLLMYRGQVYRNNTRQKEDK